MINRAKFKYVRSKKLLTSCRDLPCQNCGINDGTCVAAHSNMAKHGKGKSIKASDVYIAALCYKCHTALDQGSVMTRAEREAMHEAARIKTLNELIRRNQWPASIPTPEETTHENA